jgi:hypothetical protein
MIGDSYRIMEGNGDVYSPHTPAKTYEEFDHRWNILKDEYQVVFKKYNSLRTNTVIESLLKQPCQIKWGRHLMIKVGGYKIETSPIMSIKNTGTGFIFETEDGKSYSFERMV